MYLDIATTYWSYTAQICSNDENLKKELDDSFRIWVHNRYIKLIEPNKVKKLSKFINNGLEFKFTSEYSFDLNMEMNENIITFGEKKLYIFRISEDEINIRIGSKDAEIIQLMSYWGINGVGTTLACHSRILPINVIKFNSYMEASLESEGTAITYDKKTVLAFKKFTSEEIIIHNTRPRIPYSFDYEDRYDEDRENEKRDMEDYLEYCND